MASNLPSTQSHLDIEDIREDLVLLKNGNLSMVLESSSLNFELLAPEEQDVRILAFSSLLNALDFKVQIVIRTERTDMNDYLEKLVSQRDKSTSVALRKQMEIYMRFIQNLTVKTDILNKRFLIVVSTTFILPKSTPSVTDLIMGKGQQVDVYKNLERAHEFLNPKKDFMIKQFANMGLKLRPLQTEELIQLYYDIYDPDKVDVKRVEIEDGEFTSSMVAPLRGSVVDDVIGANEFK